MSLFSLLSLSLSTLIGSALAFPEDGSDLTTFITRPDIKAPIFDVKIHNEDRVSPGYWFVAPYWQIPPEEPSSRYMPCQIGPHIYDGNGSLVWTGACDYKNANVFDFHTVEIDSTTYLTLIHNNELDLEKENGYGAIIDENYREKIVVPTPEYTVSFNMHEFNVINNGKTALSNIYNERLLDLADWNIDGEGWVTSGGIFEHDVETGEVLFQWDGYEHIPLSESTIAPPTEPPALPGWDYIHVNAVDKTPNGDYLLSARFTDSILLISPEGEIVWRLGGKKNDFDFIDDFMFHRQHHVRHVESNSTHLTISILNNASDEWYHDGGKSSVQIIQLDLSASPMTATLLRHYDRPDGDLTRLRGSAQLLPDGNVFAGWSAQGYHSEFTEDGEVVMEARFISDRYSSYRSYKSEWTGRPTTVPDIKSMAFGSTTSDITTTVWASWNGATEVASWNFYARASEDSNPVLLGNVAKTGFETMFMATGYMGWVTAEALDADGNSLSESEVEETTAPANWEAAGFNTAEESPSPMDPATIMENKEKTVGETLDKDPNQKPVQGSKSSTDSSESNTGLAIFCITLAVVVGCGILFGLFWFFRPYLDRSRKSYLPVASDADGEMMPVMRESHKNI